MRGSFVWCSVLQCVAVWCSVLQCVAMCCSGDRLSISSLGFRFLMLKVYDLEFVFLSVSAAGLDF